MVLIFLKILIIIYLSISVLTDFSALAVCTETTNCSSENNQFPDITTGQSNYNTAHGYHNLGMDITSGDANTVVGYESGSKINTGNYNTAVGSEGLTALISGNSNTSIGYRAGYSNQTGSRNVFIGNLAGSNAGTTVTDRLYIDNSATNSPLIYGDFDSNIVTINDNLTITGYFTDGNYTFDTNGNVSGLGTVSSGTITSSGNLEANGSIIIGSANITESELETIDGVTAGTVMANKAIIVDNNKNIAGFNVVSSNTIKTNTIQDTNGDRFIYKDTTNDIVHIGNDSMLFFDSSTYGKDIMASSTGNIQIGRNKNDSTTILGDLIIQDPTQADHAATRRYVDQVGLMATTLDTRLPLYGNKHALNLSSASTNNEIAFGLNFVGIYDGLHLPLDFSFGSAFSGNNSMGKFSVGMSW